MKVPSGPNNPVGGRPADRSTSGGTLPGVVLPLLLIGICLVGLSFAFLVWVYASGRLSADTVDTPDAEER
jgi:hypothetical protein